MCAKLFVPPRREFLYGLGATLGTAALNTLLQADEARKIDGAAKSGGDANAERVNPLAAKPAHHRAKAKACIMLFMEGGPSHIDTFDPKPKLNDVHMQAFERQDKFASAMASGQRYYVQSPFKFRQVGQSGLQMCDVWEHLPRVADELCVYRGLQAQSINHPTACYHMNTGNQFGGDPALGAWVTYGLGSENANLPAFVVLPEAAYPQGGAANWGNGFMPAFYQGTSLRAAGSPILDLRPPRGVTTELQRRNLDLLAEWNEADRARHPHDDELAARMHAYELAFRMQADVPAIVDLGQESEATRQRYGMGQRETDDFGRRCLLARRLVEQGVRFVQVYSGGWDSHDFIERSHRARIRSVDQPIAALLEDLKQRGLLDETLVVWCGEFGRSPDNGVRGGAQAAGRDHNARAMAMWLAGGGVRRGQVIGATDELGATAVEAVHPIRDLHVTLLHLLGLSDNQLTYFHEGRFKQLSQTGGEVIKELLG
ncbi:MAG: DUF1501 domain-containing protein [Planctomycetes bacterium]|nr:DUF1501 domain-containing protein [Planctomycetota bacterium]